MTIISQHLESLTIPPLNQRNWQYPTLNKTESHPIKLSIIVINCTTTSTGYYRLNHLPSGTSAGRVCGVNLTTSRLHSWCQSTLGELINIEKLSTSKFAYWSINISDALPTIPTIHIMVYQLNSVYWTARSSAISSINPIKKIGTAIGPQLKTCHIRQMLPTENCRILLWKILHKLLTVFFVLQFTIIGNHGIFHVHVNGDIKIE